MHSYLTCLWLFVGQKTKIKSTFPIFSLGTSDPYVKFKADGKQIYKSRTIPKNLNPQWNEKFCVPIEDISMPLVIKVFDFDRVGSDDPMGMVSVDLAQMEVGKYVLTVMVEDRIQISCNASSDP